MVHHKYKKGKKKGETQWFSIGCAGEDGRDLACTMLVQTQTDSTVILCCDSIVPLHNQAYIQHTWRKRAVENYFMCNLIILV